MSRSPRILLTRLSHIGDCVLTLPVLSALREHFRNAHIAWAMEKPSAKLLRAHRALDEVIEIPRGWLKSPSTVMELRNRLRDMQFDVTIDPQGLTKSTALAWLSGAPRRIGLQRPWSGELAPWLNNELVPVTQTHIVLRSLELLRPLGIRKPDVRFGLPLHTEALEMVDNYVIQQHLGSGFALINPGASWGSKRWEMDRFGVVAKRLGHELGLTSVVLWAGPEEHNDAIAVVDRSGGHAILGPQTSLSELAALCSRARLFVSSDTGPLHIAAAVGAPCVGLYGPTRPDHCGAFGEQCINVQQWYQDGSRKQRRRAENLAMRDIDVDQVLSACHNLVRESSEELYRAAA